jgi:hypothetical protein
MSLARLDMRNTEDITNVYIILVRKAVICEAEVRIGNIKNYFWEDRRYDEEKQPLITRYVSFKIIKIFSSVYVGNKQHFGNG